MTIKQQGGIFGRNPTFNNLTVDNDLTVTNDITTDKLIANDKIGIGTASPSQKLHLYESGSGDVFIEIDNTQVGEATLIGKQGSSAYGASAVGNAAIYTYDNSISIMADGGAGNTASIKFSTGGNAQRMILDQNGHLSLTGGGNVVMNSGSGIDFSATSGTGTSELFDDYEEGTWTPVVADASSGGNEASYTSNTGFYTKIGRQVFLTIRFININTTGMTAGNQIFITGLPFASANDTRATVASAVRPVAVSSTAGNLVAAMGPNTTAMSVSNVTTSGSSNALVSQITSGGGDLFINVQYVAT